MKIIAGRWGGRKLRRKPNPKMRPTADKVKESVFSMIEARYVSSWDDVRVLDLFAGTGAYALEALSRGAKKAFFVDIHLKTTQEIRSTLREFEVEDAAEVLCRGALEAINLLNREGQVFDLIFLDPPYREDWVVATLNRLREKPIFHSKSIIIAEHDKREALSPIEGSWSILNSRRFGDSAISVICPKDAEAYWKKKDE